MAEQKRRVSKMKFLAAFALACLLFIGGILVGNQITQSKVNDILSIEKDARLQLENLELEEKLLSDAKCMSPSLLSESLIDMGTRLTMLESEYSKNDPRILDLKKPYTLLEVRHYLAMKSMTERCDQNYTFVLFFYSNSPENVDLSEKQGFVLDYLKKKYDKQLNIYSFDYDLDLPIVKVLAERYNIKLAPSMVVGENVYVGFHEKDEMESVIASSFNN